MSYATVHAIALRVRQICRVPDDYATGEVEQAIHQAIREAGEAAAKLCEERARYNKSFSGEQTGTAKACMHEDEHLAATIRQRLPAKE